MAGEAIGDILRRADDERCRLLIMERTERLEIRPCLLQVHVPSDQLHDADPCVDLLRNGQIPKRYQNNARWLSSHYIEISENA